MQMIRTTLVALLIIAGSGGACPVLASDSTDQPPADLFTGQLNFAIYVADVQASTQFYRDVLGFEFLGYLKQNPMSYVQDWEGETPPTYAAFQACDQKFGLQLPQRLEDEACVGCGRYFFRVNDLEAHHTRIAAQGVTMSPILNSDILKRFYVFDPDGLKIYFAQSVPGAPVDPW